MAVWVWYVIMAVALLAMVWCAKNQKSVANAQTYAIVCLAVVALSAIMVFYNFFFKDDTAQSIENGRQFEMSKLDAVATYINKNFAGKNVVLIVKSDMQNLQNGQMDIINEFKKLAKDVNFLEDVVIKVMDPREVMGSPDQPPQMPMMPPEEYLNATTFNAAFADAKKQKADVIVDFAGLPMSPEDTKNLKFWSWKPSDPKVIIYEIPYDIGSVCFPEDFGKVLMATVTSKPEIKFDFLEDKAPSDLKAAFDIRFVLVTADNIKSLMDQKLVNFPEK